MGLVQVIESYGVELRRAGKELLGLCPFHPDRHPSFSVSSEKEKWHCFGCQAGGDTITFVMKIENINFKAAVKMLGRKELPRTAPKPEPERIWAKAQLLRVNEVLREINQSLQLAEELKWEEEIERLTREYDILETLAEDLANPKYIDELFNEKDWVENVLGGVDV